MTMRKKSKKSVIPVQELQPEVEPGSLVPQCQPHERRKLNKESAWARFQKMEHNMQQFLNQFSSMSGEERDSIICQFEELKANSQDDMKHQYMLNEHLKALVEIDDQLSGQNSMWNHLKQSAESSFKTCVLIYLGDQITKSAINEKSYLYEALVGVILFWMLVYSGRWWKE